MKRVKSLEEARTIIREMFRNEVKAMFEKAVKELTAEELIAAIRKVKAQLTIVHIPDGLNEFVTMKFAFREELTILNKVSPEFKNDPSLVWNTVEETIAEITADSEVPFATAPDTLTEVVTGELHNEVPSPDEFSPAAEIASAEAAIPPAEQAPAPVKKGGRKISFEGLDGEQVDLNKFRVAGKVYVGILDDARMGFVSTKHGKSWPVWVEATFFMFKGEVSPKPEAPRKPAVLPADGKVKKEKAPKAPKAEKAPKAPAAPEAPAAPHTPFDITDESNVNTPEFLTEKIKGCKDEAELKAIIDYIQRTENSSIVFHHTASNLNGVITGTKTNSGTGKPVLKTTLSDGSGSKSFCDIFTRYFSLIDNREVYASIHAEIAATTKK